MNQFLIKSSNVRGEISIPSSKSQTLRAILFGSLGLGKTEIHRYLHSNDTFNMIEACRSFGATITIHPETIYIEGINGHLQYAKDVINAGNSGIVLRFCSAVGALASKYVVITGDDSIKYQRPMGELLKGLNQLGVSATSMRGDHFAPVIIQGPLRSGSARINGADSQPVSALLIAAAFASGPIEIHVDKPGEKPWIALTLEWFRKLSIPFEQNNYDYYKLQGNARYSGFQYTVPGDLSSAAFPIAAAIVTNSILTIKNVDLEDPQGDKELISIFQRMGAAIEIDKQNKELHVKPTTRLMGINIDLNNCIDAIAILAVVACFGESKTHIYNVANAKNKESNRILAISTELKKMGAQIDVNEDGLTIYPSILKGAVVESHNDHRIAMALAVAALGAKGNASIRSVQCVAKTYPTFLNDFKTIGACIEEVVSK